MKEYGCQLIEKLSKLERPPYYHVSFIELLENHDVDVDKLTQAEWCEQLVLMRKCFAIEKVRRDCYCLITHGNPRNVTIKWKEQTCDAYFASTTTTTTTTTTETTTLKSLDALESSGANTITYPCKNLFFASLFILPVLLHLLGHLQ